MDSTFFIFFGDYKIKTGDKNKSRFYGVLAGVERIELPSAVLETDILPLYYTPMVTRTRFELVNDAVKGRCVKPLHQRAILVLKNNSTPF